MQLLRVQPYVRSLEISQAMIEAGVAAIERFPEELAQTLSRLNAEQIATKTLPGKWTVSQVVHHTADSHMNAFIRCKLALTEDVPTIKPYEEADWAQRVDAGTETPARLSLELLTALHGRWTKLLKSLQPDEWKRGYFHPGEKREFLLEEVVCLYAWHGRNHLAHIHELMQAKGWG
ncbi:MAG: putative metal-dependent hydrolase [Spirochaetia bacterium]|nr:putative metal-dependent hydrolase [Spirochaetia bacterium]